MLAHPAAAGRKTSVEARLVVRKRCCYLTVAPPAKAWQQKVCDNRAEARSTLPAGFRPHLFRKRGGVGDKRTNIILLSRSWREPVDSIQLSPSQSSLVLVSEHISNPVNMAPPTLVTPLCELLGIKYPILLAGMARTSSGPLAAAVSNAGGLGTIGGLGYSPQQMRDIIHELKANLSNPDLPFGVDLALPQVGGSARKTNHDYTHGQLDELIGVVIEEKARLFISAVGVPPPHVIKRLHEAGILVMNMVGHPKHAHKALQAGVDIVCAQGGEGGGHTGDIATSILIPSVVDVASQYKSPLTGRPAMVVAAGGIYNGRSLAAMLSFGAVGAWVGTRFVASKEAGCSELHKEAVVSAKFEDTMRTLVVSGRPLRVKRNAYIDSWEVDRPEEVKRLCDSGVVPLQKDMDEDKDFDIPFLMGQVAGVIERVQPAKEILEEMVTECVQIMQTQQTYLSGAKSKL